MFAYTSQAFLTANKLSTRILTRSMGKFTDGVEFDTIAREWRVKWSATDDKKSLASLQQTLSLFKGGVSKVDGVKSIQRIICGGCYDFKVIVALDANKFGAWEEKKFAPEEDFLAAIKAIPGVTQVETQTYTIEPVV
eukprot:gene4976-6959_t